MKQTNTRLDDVKSQSSETMIRKTAKQHYFFLRNKKNNSIPTNQSIVKKTKTLIPNNLIVIVTLIALVGSLEDPYKISI